MAMAIDNWKKKGIVFTIDSIIAITLVTLILLTSTGYYVRSQENLLPGVQLVRTGNDLLNLLDITGGFENMNLNELREGLYLLLPATYDMKINITWQNGNSYETESEELPLDRFIGTGERLFVTDTLEFGIARFWIWSKN
jgi:hypothetical protein